MADFSRVDIFFDFCEAEGIASSWMRDFLRTGFFGSVDDEVFDDDASNEGLAERAAHESVEPIDFASCEILQTGHFLASSESSGTSTTSLCTIRTRHT
jgi:hypothetical protein